MSDLIEIFVIMIMAVLSIAQDESLCFDQDNSECLLDHQSPIELISYESFLCHDITPIRFENFDFAFETPQTLLNNGKTAEVKLSDPHFASISGGPLFDSTFYTLGIHFHWGSHNAVGSEHIIDSRRFSMEMHIVHRNSKYESTEEALRHKDGLAVLGILFNVEETEFAGLAKITDNLADIREYNTSTAVNNLILSELFGDISTENYYFYEGSLTTPPCSRAVSWFIFSEVIPISTNQINLFRTLYNKLGNVLQNNYRCLQPKGLRLVCRSYSYENSNDTCRSNNNKRSAPSGRNINSA